MLVHPQIDPVAIAIGPLAVHWYGLMYVCAFAAFILLGRQRIRSQPETRWSVQELDDLLSEREKLNVELQSILDRATDPWGVKVTKVEIKHVDLPAEMQRAMAKQAEAERERRGKVINAEGEFQAAAKMAEAAHVLAQEPMSLTLRYLQTLREIAAEKNSTTLFPIPIDLLTPFMKMANRWEKLEEEQDKAKEKEKA